MAVYLQNVLYFFAVLSPVYLRWHILKLSPGSSGLDAAEEFIYGIVECGVAFQNILMGVVRDTRFRMKVVLEDENR